MQRGKSSAHQQWFKNAQNCSAFRLLPAAEQQCSRKCRKECFEKHCAAHTLHHTSCWCCTQAEAAARSVTRAGGCRCRAVQRHSCATATTGWSAAGPRLEEERGLCSLLHRCPAALSTPSSPSCTPSTSPSLSHYQIEPKPPFVKVKTGNKMTILQNGMSV